MRLAALPAAAVAVVTKTTATPLNLLRPVLRESADISRSEKQLATPAAQYPRDYFMRLLRCIIDYRIRASEIVSFASLSCNDAGP